MTVPLVAAKQQLRSLMRQRLSSLSQDAVLAQSRRIYEALQDFKPYRDATRISIFLSMPTGEVQTDAIVRHALGCGKQVFVPYLHKPDAADGPARVMDMVSLTGIHDYESLRPDRWGIPSVDPATLDRRRRVLGGSAELDLMLMPGVAFDLDGAGRIRRLGHGKGFYDFFLNRYLAAADGHPPLLLYGLALTEQLLSASPGEQVPVDLHDRNLHGLILGSGQLREASSSSGTQSTVMA
ncbi:5-formyltetrahydrofolate cyclo-ligase family protein [Hirsutella rhossiliensis]|uniref:5-formyltetrahydrofolate cyclo-ligase n=1 Tax=Hirsutella rhossiliensis TaxID=111463 RepID=A0A9P8N2U9_9HYPO|nr:5-formyltetrahydrofolate cyclo-ligase family domain-containing protein [Hirsutella rhossiliensis]KAH0965865.1 5-formyltetrahydrofolate cyclo-ligase family domain-containing protein [Hirsutella rhossiliensis]